MIYAVSGFVFGLLIPYLARRFSKFMPATFAYGLYRIFRQNKKVSKAKRKNNHRYEKLMRRYLMRSLGWAIITSALSFLMIYQFGGYHCWWYLGLLWSLLLLTEIDYRMELLPDIITIPLLMMGFGFAVFAGDWATPQESAIGALGGYFIPVMASLFLVWKSPDAFGGGDIKLLAALGAWFGLENLIVIIVLACVIFGIYALIYKKRDAAFGPSIAVAAIAVAFYFL